MRSGAEMTDPFFITGPAVISFSGGRTSAYMLWRILQAHSGVLPGDVVVVFDNTGREMPATLDFVQACSDRWNVHIHWIEYRWSKGGPSFEIVSHNAASRNGEPLEQLFAGKSMLPNPVARFCTVETKIRTTKRFLRFLGWDHWTNVVGLRADEMRRVDKAMDRERTKKDRWHNACPLADAGVDQAEVFQFWKGQPFDLELAGPWEGNCDGCFLKGRSAIERMLKDHPDRMRWWAEQEAKPRGPGAGATFRADREPYAEMANVVERQGGFPFDLAREGFLPCDDAGCGI